jgi:signal transduction histidine kinase
MLSRLTQALALLWTVWTTLSGPLAHAAQTSASAEASNLIVSQAVFRDTTGRMTLPDVADAPFLPLQGVFAGGYTTDVVWLRLVVKPAPDGGPVVLRVLPAYLNTLTLFTPHADGQWDSQTSGNSVPWQSRPYQALSLGFTLRPAAENTYFLRLQTASNALMSVQASSTADATRLELQSVVWQGLYGALILWVVLWALQEHLLRRDRLTLTFAVAYGVYFVYVLAIQGYLSLLVPSASWIGTATSYAVTLAVLSSLVFHRSVLGLFELPRPAMWTLNALPVIAAANVLLLVLEHTTLALKLNSLLALVSAPVLWGIAMAGKGHALPGITRVRVFYGVVCLSVLAYVLPILGLGQGSVWALYGAIIQGLVSAVLFANMLHARSRELMRQGAAAELSLALASQEVAQHKAQLDEQTRFTAMLTHELKNPLAAIRLSLDTLESSASTQTAKRRQRIDRALADIDALVERCAVTDRIEQQQDQVRVCDIPLEQWLADVLAGLPDSSRVQVAIDRHTPTTLDTDPGLLAVALTNLLDNALKHSPPDSPVNLRVQAKPDTTAYGPGIRMVVRNNIGPAGLPDPARVFEKYYRGQGTSRLSGFGLGLYLVREIALQLGGQAVCVPQPDNNSIEFSLCLPQTPR